MAIELSPGYGGEIISPVQLLVAKDLAKLNALTQPGSGVVTVEYLLLVERMGSKPHHVANFATPDFGANEYRELISEMMPAQFEVGISEPIERQLN